MELAEKDDRPVHVYPSYGREHRIGSVDDKCDCWCSPEVEDYRPTGGVLLFIHREEN